MSALQSVAIKTINLPTGMTQYDIVDKQTGWMIAEDFAGSYVRAIEKAERIDAEMNDPELQGWRALDLI